MTHLSSISSRARVLHAFAHLTVLLLVAAFAGCGNDSNDQAPGDPGGGGGPPGRGGLLEESSALVTTLSAGNFLPGLSEPARQALLLQAGAPVCDVAVYKIRYATVGGRDEATDASGALMVPGGIADRCRGGRPIVLLCARHVDGKDFRPDAPRRRGERRGPVPGGVLRRAGIHRRGAELRGLRHVLAALRTRT